MLRGACPQGLRVVARHTRGPVASGPDPQGHSGAIAVRQLLSHGRSASSAPATDGYGVYLVVWFGKAGIPVPPEGSIPDDANELRARLLGALSDAERRKISVVVIDVSRA